ncbi:MAG: hypothetical protein CMJ64_18120 [Planctomycetaceae bacterium]|nr:hypothetical protein [Planctomycetaceae bacterium]
MIFEQKREANTPNSANNSAAKINIFLPLRILACFGRAADSGKKMEWQEYASVGLRFRARPHLRLAEGLRHFPTGTRSVLSCGAIFV